MDGSRQRIELRRNDTVAALKAAVVREFLIPPNLPPTEDETSPSREVLVLEYLQGELHDRWRIGDLNIHTGATIRAFLRQVCHLHVTLLLMISRELFSNSEING